MLNFICKSLSFSHLRHSLTTISPKHYHHLQLLSFSISSSSSKVTSENPTTKDGSFTVNYLVNKCGFSPKMAISASKYFNLENADHQTPAAVISLLKKLGFDETQICTLIRTHPIILSYPTDTLLRPIYFLVSQGVVGKEMTEIVYKTKLHPEFIPSFTSLKALLGYETTAKIIRCPKFLTEFQHSVGPNLEILRKAGVPEFRLPIFFNYPEMFLSPPTLKQIVEKVGKMGIDPSKSAFMNAIHVFGRHTRSSWEKKIELFKELGCSEDEVWAAFKLRPQFFNVSEQKIKDVMNILVNEMGWDPSRVMRCTDIFWRSMENKIIPRCSVYRILLSKGLIEESTNLHELLIASEDEFCQTYVEPYTTEIEAENPVLIEFYEETLLAIANRVL